MHDRTAKWLGEAAQAGVGDGKVVAGLDAQMHQLAKNQTATLQAAGLTLEDIVSGHVYLADMGDYDGMNAIYRQYFSKGPGVRTTLMPGKGRSPDEPRVMGSFIAAKTQPAKP